MLSGIFCIIADNLIKSEIYSDYVQAHFALSGYLKLPNNIGGYLSKCRFLPKLNNELHGERNETYKQRFTSLQNLVLIMFEHDIVLIPKETSWFGYYPDGAFRPVLPTQQTKLYTEDWIGLKTLDDAGRVKYIKVAGNHAGISKDDMKKYVVPYLEDPTSKEGSVHPSSVDIPMTEQNVDRSQADGSLEAAIGHKLTGHWRQLLTDHRLTSGHCQLQASSKNFFLLKKIINLYMKLYNSTSWYAWSGAA